jgi:hypothetical protein
MGRQPIGQQAMTAAERQRRHRGELTTPPMTKAEVLGLQNLIRKREKVLKSAAAQRSAELMADFEQQLASQYSFDQDEIWKQANEAAQRAVDEAQAIIAARCLELGIPTKFAPGIGLGWYKRGENAAKERRAELRLVAKTRIAAIEKETCLKIELHSVELQTQVLAQGLTSEAARAFLESMPAVETLMPTLELTKIEHMLESRKQRTY